VEKIEDPKAPPGFRSATPPAAEDPRNAGITFAVLGTPGRHGTRTTRRSAVHPWAPSPASRLLLRTTPCAMSQSAERCRMSAWARSSAAGN
jgi:hypothetical protein